MSLIAIVGAGPAGGALAHKLAARNRVGEVRLVDPERKIADGMALDILQSSPIERFSTRVTASASVLSAAGADVIVIADQAAGSAEHAGEAGLALLGRIAGFEQQAPIVFMGASQRELIARGVSELHIAAARLLGSAPLALESALRAIAGLMVDGSGVEVSLRVVGVPPKSAVIALEEATAFGQPLASVLPPHQMAALSARIPGLWPPGPYALASAAARVVEGIAAGARRRYSCFVSVSRGRVASMPVELGAGGVRRVLEPSLTRQERTLLENAIERS